MKRFLSFLIGAAGLALSVYLFSRFLAVRSGATDPGICKVVFGYSCDPEAGDKTSLLLGLPWSGWGIIYFAVLFLLMVLTAYLPGSFRKTGSVSLLLLLLGGNAIGFYLTWLMLSGASPICFFCLLTHLFDLLLLLLVWKSYELNMGSVLMGLKRGVIYVFTGRSESGEQGKWQLIALVVPILFALAVYQRLAFPLSHHAQHEPLIPTFDMLAEFQHTEPVDLTISSVDAKLGPDSAVLKMVVYSDFECPYCASFAAQSKLWVDRFHGKFQLIFKHFPLSSGCNPFLEDDMHPNACLAARISQAAHDQNKFWEFHDLLFENEVSEENAMRWAEELGLDLERFKAHLGSDSGLEKVLDDVASAGAFGVAGTPSVFLNGRKLSEVQPQNIQLLLDNLLRMAEPVRE